MSKLMTFSHVLFASAFLLSAATMSYADIENNNNNDPYAQHNSENKGAEPELKLPEDLKPEPVKASPEETKKLEAMLMNFLKSEKGVEALQKVQQRAAYMEAQHERETSKLLEANKDKLLQTKDNIVLGNPKGKVKMVLIADPLCENCHILQNILQKVVKKSGDVQIVLHQWAFVKPEESARVARYLKAAYDIDASKYAKLYEAFLALKNVPDQKMMDSLIKGAGYTLGDVEAKVKNDKTSIENTERLAKDMKLPGAPILMVQAPDDKMMLIPPVSEEELVKVVAELGKAMSKNETKSV